MNGMSEKNENKKKAFFSPSQVSEKVWSSSSEEHHKY